MEVYLFSEIALQKLALLSLEAADGFLLNLAYTLAGEVEFGTDFFERHLLASDSEEHFQNLTLAVVELTEGAVHLLDRKSVV